MMNNYNLDKSMHVGADSLKDLIISCINEHLDNNQYYLSIKFFHCKNNHSFQGNLIVSLRNTLMFHFLFRFCIKYTQPRCILTHNNIPQMVLLQLQNLSMVDEDFFLSSSVSFHSRLESDSFKTRISTRFLTMHKYVLVHIYASKQLKNSCLLSSGKIPSLFF